MWPAKGPQKGTGQLGGYNGEAGAQSRVNTNRRNVYYRCVPLSDASQASNAIVLTATLEVWASRPHLR